MLPTASLYQLTVNLPNFSATKERVVWDSNQLKCISEARPGCAKWSRWRDSCCVWHSVAAAAAVAAVVDSWHYLAVVVLCVLCEWVDCWWCSPRSAAERRRPSGDSSPVNGTSGTAATKVHRSHFMSAFLYSCNPPRGLGIFRLLLTKRVLV